MLVKTCSRSPVIAARVFLARAIAGRGGENQDQAGGTSQYYAHVLMFSHIGITVLM